MRQAFGTSWPRLWHLSVRSANSKTGPISVTTSAQSTCPVTCGQWNKCYAKAGKMYLFWKQLSAGTFKTATTLAGFVGNLRALKAGGMIRLNQAGDLPGDGRRLRIRDAKRIARAVEHLLGWTYTHYHKRAQDVRTVQAINRDYRLTVNYSADSMAEAEQLMCSGPTTVVVPETFATGQRTPILGKRIAICPAQLSTTMTCMTCGNGRPLCARKDRDYLVAFRAHGALRNK